MKQDLKIFHVKRLMRNMWNLVRKGVKTRTNGRKNGEQLSKTSFNVNILFFKEKETAQTFFLIQKLFELFLWFGSAIPLKSKPRMHTWATAVPWRRQGVCLILNYMDLIQTLLIFNPETRLLTWEFQETSFIWFCGFKRKWRIFFVRVKKGSYFERLRRAEFFEFD